MAEVETGDTTECPRCGGQAVYDTAKDWFRCACGWRLKMEHGVPVFGPLVGSWPQEIAYRAMLCRRFPGQPDTSLSAHQAVTFDDATQFRGGLMSERGGAFAGTAVAGPLDSGLQEFIPMTEGQVL